MSLEYKVPRILWENFEAVLLAQSRRYIGELAARLEVSEKELQKRVLPTSDTLKVIIQDTQSETNQCKAYIQNDKLTQFCRKPVVYGCEFCAFHRNKRMIVIDEMNPIRVQRIKDTNRTGPLWINDSILYNNSGDFIGRIDKDNKKIKMFIINTEDGKT